MGVRGSRRAVVPLGRVQSELEQVCTVELAGLSKLSVLMGFTKFSFMTRMAVLVL